MSEQHQSRARAAAEPEEAGLDVWLPVLVAIAAAFFLLLSATAQEAAPRTIYDAQRFAMTEAERTVLEESAARRAGDLAVAPRALNRTAAHVEMLALPALPVAGHDTVAMAPAPSGPVHVATRPDLVAAREAPEPAPGWTRLALALAIAAMLGGALYLLDRTWHRTGPAPLTTAQATA